MTNVRQRDEMKGWDDLLIDSDPVLSAGWQGLYFDEE